MNMKFQVRDARNPFNVQFGPQEEDHNYTFIPRPRLPTMKEVVEHCLTHVPYQNWCPHRVRSRGKDSDHRKAVEKEFRFDCCFPRDEKVARITVPVERERVTGTSRVSAVPVKGTSGQFAAMGCWSFQEDRPGAGD